MKISSKVPSKYNNVTLLNYLAGRFTYLTRDEWEERITEGRLFRGGYTLGSDEILKLDDVVEYDMPDFKEPEADLNYSVIYEDQWLLGINKTGNLLVHHKGLAFKSNLIYQLRYVHEPAFLESSIINRLDRETSGVVLVAKSKEYVKAFSDLFVNREITKEYIAVCHGVPTPDMGTITKKIMKDPCSQIRSKFTTGDDGKDAVTEYETVMTLGGKSFGVIKLFPKTGRTHQLRVHLKSLQCPIVGDKLYWLSEEEFLARKKGSMENQPLLMKRHGLHCRAMSFIHPFTTEECVIEAPLPEDMNSFISKYKNCP